METGNTMDSSLPKTDLQRWRLKSTEGVHHWFYLSEEQAKQQQQSVAERYFLGYPTVCTHLDYPPRAMPMLTTSSVGRAHTPNTGVLHRHGTQWLLFLSASAARRWPLGLRLWGA